MSEIYGRVAWPGGHKVATGGVRAQPSDGGAYTGVHQPIRTYRQGRECLCVKLHVLAARCSPGPDDYGCVLDERFERCDIEWWRWGSCE